MFVSVTVYNDDYGLKVSENSGQIYRATGEEIQPEVFSLSNPVLVMKIVLNKDFVYSQVKNEVGKIPTIIAGIISIIKSFVPLNRKYPLSRVINL